MNSHGQQNGPRHRTNKPTESGNTLAFHPSQQTTRRTKRYKVDTACDLCRRRKVKCDGVRPACGNCQKKQVLRGGCHYNYSTNDESALADESTAQVYASVPALTAPNDGVINSNPNHSVAQAPALANNHLIPRVPASADVPSTHSPQPVGNSNDDLRRYGGGNVRTFTDRLKAAVDAKLGLPRAERPILVPTTDAPLFLAPDERSAPSGTSSQDDHVLPPRKHADQLVLIYWGQLHPLNPLIDRKQFETSYNALFSGTLIDSEERIFLSILNIILALSTQCQEHITLSQRQQASLTYFNRAWNLLRPGQAIWEPASLELVECFLLAGSYLQCTSKSHQTWMAIGSAIRIAQSLGLHLPQVSFGDEMSGECRRRRLWRSCIFLDKQISMAFGRPTTIHEDLTNVALEYASDSIGNDIEAQNPVSEDDFAIKTLEVYSIAYGLFHVTTSIEARRNRLGHAMATSHAEEDKDYIQTALRLDSQMDIWRQRHSGPLKSDIDLLDPTNDKNYRRLVVSLRLRNIHGRIILFRPMLAQFCLSQCPIPSGATGSQTLRQRIIHDCACICITDAQEVISFFEEDQGPDASSGMLLPWWMRLYYLHVAATVLIAATLRFDISTQFAIQESWNRLVSILDAHEHLSAFIQQHIEVLKTLSFEVLQTRLGDLGECPIPPEELDAAAQQDFFRDGSYFNSVPFDLEDIFHLNNV